MAKHSGTSHFLQRAALLIGLYLLLMAGCDPQASIDVSKTPLSAKENSDYANGQWHALSTEILGNAGWKNDPVRIALILEAGIHHCQNLHYTASAYGDILTAELKLLQDSLHIKRPHQHFVQGTAAYIQGDLGLAADNYQQSVKSGAKNEPAMAGRSAFLYAAAQQDIMLWDLFKPDRWREDSKALIEISAETDPNFAAVSPILNATETLNDLFEYAFTPLSIDSTSDYIGKTFDVVMFPLIGNRLLQRLNEIAIPDSLPTNIRNRIALERGMIRYHLTHSTVDLQVAMKTLKLGSAPKSLATMVAAAEGYIAAQSGDMPNDLLIKLVAANATGSGSRVESVKMDHVVAALKSSQNSEPLRAALYTQFWIHLWQTDRSSCDLMWQRIQYSYTIQNPDYFIPILPFMARFDNNSARLGMQYLKTLANKFPELRVLIPGYEMILRSGSKPIPEPVKS